MANRIVEYDPRALWVSYFVPSLAAGAAAAYQYGKSALALGKRARNAYEDVSNFVSEISGMCHVDNCSCRSSCECRPQRRSSSSSRQATLPFPGLLPRSSLAPPHYAERIMTIAADVATSTNLSGFVNTRGVFCIRAEADNARALQARALVCRMLQNIHSTCTCGAHDACLNAHARPTRLFFFLTRKR